jgi:hypothetical protein
MTKTWVRVLHLCVLALSDANVAKYLTTVLQRKGSRYYFCMSDPLSADSYTFVTCHDRGERACRACYQPPGGPGRPALCAAVHRRRLRTGPNGPALQGMSHHLQQTPFAYGYKCLPGAGGKFDHMCI